MTAQRTKIHFHLPHRFIGFMERKLPMENIIYFIENQVYISLNLPSEFDRKVLPSYQFHNSFFNSGDLFFGVLVYMQQQQNCSYKIFHRHVQILCDRSSKDCAVFLFLF